MDRKIDENKKGKNLYRTATTAYPCFLPDLGDSAGAGRTSLTRGKDTTFFIKQNFLPIFF